MKRSDLIIIACAVILLGLLFPILTGTAKLMIVLSGSMTPIMLPGDMIVVEKVNPTDLKVGDVIAFQEPGGKPNTVFTHRIIDVRDNGTLSFQTKGDANNVQDDFRTPADNVKGKLIFVIPYLGWLPSMAKNKVVFFATIILPVSILIIDEIMNMLRYSNPAKARKFEQEQRKKTKLTTRTMNYKLFVTLALVGGLVSTACIMGGISNVGTITLNEKNVVTGGSIFSSVYVITTDDPARQLEVLPWYGTLDQGEQVTVNAPQDMKASVCEMPYVLPVYWIVALAKINSWLPSVVATLWYTIAFVFLWIPFWYKKNIRGSFAKKLAKNSVMSKVKRMISRA